MADIAIIVDEDEFYRELGVVVRSLLPDWTDKSRGVGELGRVCFVGLPGVVAVAQQLSGKRVMVSAKTARAKDDDL